MSELQRFECPGCQKRLKVAAAARRGNITCPKCGTRFPITSASPQPSASSAAVTLPRAKAAPIQTIGDAALAFICYPETHGPYRWLTLVFIGCLNLIQLCAAIWARVSSDPEQFAVLIGAALGLGPVVMIPSLVALAFEVCRPLCVLAAWVNLVQFLVVIALFLMALFAFNFAGFLAGVGTLLAALLYLGIALANTMIHDV